jgi:crotonobetainyl-CoA:carnitine CoA-transferase CaiB-like acyl-CoA transferase
VADPHYQARDMLLDTELPDGVHVKMPGIVPKLSDTPGQVRWQGPTLGEHTDNVLLALGVTAAEIAALRERGVVA